jgi:hypothetical protein
MATRKKKVTHHKRRRTRKKKGMFGIGDAGEFEKLGGWLAGALVGNLFRVKGLSRATKLPEIVKDAIPIGIGYVLGKQPGFMGYFGQGMFVDAGVRTVVNLKPLRPIFAPVPLMQGVLGDPSDDAIKKAVEAHNMGGVLGEHMEGMESDHSMGGSVLGGHEHYEAGDGM